MLGAIEILCICVQVDHRSRTAIADKTSNLHGHVTLPCTGEVPNNVRKATSFLSVPSPPNEKLTKGVTHPSIRLIFALVPEVDEAVAVAVSAVVGLLLDRLGRGGIFGGGDDETQFDHLVARYLLESQGDST